jgi:GT2 family glycosyltransferase
VQSLARVSVVIVNWNGGAYLDRCLAALGAQTSPPEQVIVVDNASQDGSVDGLSTRYPWVRVICLEYNVGFAAATNHGARDASGSEWLVTLNPDTAPEPAWLAALLEAARARPQYASFGSHLLATGDGTRLDGTGDVYHVSGLAWRRQHGTAATSAAGMPGEIFAPCAAAAMYRRDVFLAAGGFDERYFCYFEDVDLGFRLRLLGHRSWYVPEARVVHVGSALTGRHSPFAVYHGHRNLVWTYWKNMPCLLLWLYLPQHLLLTAVAVLWFVLRGQAGAIVRTKLHGLRALPHVLRQRRVIQQRRQVGIRELRRSMAGGWLTPYLRRPPSYCRP